MLLLLGLVCACASHGLPWCKKYMPAAHVPHTPAHWALHTGHTAP